MQPRPMAETVGPRRPSCRRWMVMAGDHRVWREPREGCYSRARNGAVAAPTGVEMEALTAVAVAGLTLYDMCKAVDREMTLGAIRLVRKTGGRSGTFVRRGERA